MAKKRALRHATSDVDGKYKLIAPSSGSYVLSFDLLGFSSVQREIMLAADTPALTSNVELSAVTVTVPILFFCPGPIVDAGASQTSYVFN